MQQPCQFAPFILQIVCCRKLLDARSNWKRKIANEIVVKRPDTGCQDHDREIQIRFSVSILSIIIGDFLAKARVVEHSRQLASILKATHMLQLLDHNRFGIIGVGQLVDQSLGEQL